MRLLITLLLCILFSFAINHSMAQNKNFDKIIYHYTDATVPPPQHINYIISINIKEGNIVISDYNTVLLNQKFKIEKDLFNNLEKNSPYLEQPKQLDKGVGGAYYSLQLFSKNKEIYSFLGQPSTKINQKTQEFITMIKSSVPNLERLLLKARAIEKNKIK